MKPLPRELLFKYLPAVAESAYIKMRLEGIVIKLKGAVRAAAVSGVCIIMSGMVIGTVYAADNRESAGQSAGQNTGESTVQSFSNNTAQSAPASDNLDQDAEIEKLKSDVLNVIKDLHILQEDLLTPQGSQLAVYVSMDVGHYFKLDGIRVKVDDKTVMSHLYQPDEITALRKGGVHKLYLGNIAAGKHQLVAIYTGRGPNNRDYQLASSIDFEKVVDQPKKIELKIIDDAQKAQPKLIPKEWPPV